MKPANPLSRPPVAASRGVTLVELLVSVTLGLIITVVIAQLFLGSRQTFATTDDVSRMQENIRFAEQLLARTIHLAGYKSQPNTVASNVFKAGPPSTLALEVTDRNGGVANSTDLTNSDDITVRYQGSGDGLGAADGSVVDCTGNAVDAGQVAVNTFSIAAGANGSNALFCNGVEMVSDVVHMQVLFGEDLNADLIVDRYTAPGGAVVNNVLAVRVALLFQTPTAASKTIPDINQSFNLNGVIKKGFTDRRIRREVTTTINLRNRTP